MLCAVIVLAGCKKKEQAESSNLCSGIDFANMDTTVSPAEDFYQYACGGWLKNHPIPDEYSRYGTFEILGETNQQQLKEVISTIASKSNKKGSVAQKIGDFYNLGMDSTTLNKQGNAPLQKPLTEIAKISNKNELTNALITMHNYGFNPFFSIFGEGDPDNSSMTIAFLSQSGLGIGDQDYYLKSDKQNIRDQYIILIDKLFQLSGYSALNTKASDTKKIAKDILALETQMAKAFMDKNKMRDPFATHNIRTIAEVQKMVPGINVQQYLKGRHLEDLESVNVCQPDYFNALGKIISSTDLETLKSYLAWQYINHGASYLSDDFSAASFEFYGHQLTGATAQQPRWKRVVNTVNDMMGEAVGQLYVEKYFPGDAKDRMQKLVKDLQDALGERIKQNQWMDDSTKTKALDKLASMIVKIGYPDEWRDYSNLNITKDSYFENILKASQFEVAYQTSKIGKPTNPTEWLMSPQTVNAYYNPSTNEICFPAGILQPPFFNVNADDAVNYGAIGVVIGHEMTHGFDDQGRHYDKDGNVNDWWTEEDSKNFKARTQVLVDYFNGIEVLPGKFADGEFTLGENIADNGGLNTSFDALQRAKAEGGIAETMDGFTAEQRFFLAYAAVWANNITDAEIARRIATDPHSLGKWRVNGTLPHIDSFVKAFNIKEGDKMYIAPEKRAKIW